MEQNLTQWNKIEPKKSIRVIKPPKNQEDYLTLLSYVYVIKQQKFVDIDNPENTFTEKQFDQSYEHMRLPDNRFKPSGYIMELNKETHVVTDLVMDTSNPKRIVEIDKGLKALNLYKPTATPSLMAEAYRKPEKLLDHILWLCNGDAKAQEHILKWITHLIFKPHTRMNHGIILSGNQGTGKTFLANCIGDLVGKENFNKVSANELKSQFQHWMISKRLIIVEEIREQNNYTLYNKIKGFFSEERIYVNRKHESGINIDNHLHFFMLSNYANPIPLSKDDRRMFYLHSKVFKKPNEYYQDIFKWWKARGLINFRYYLQNEILPTLDEYFATVAPYQTQDHKDAGSASEHPVKSFILHQLDQPEDQRDSFFKTGAWFLKSDFEHYLKQQEELEKYVGGTTVMGGIFKECNLIIGSRREIDGRKITPCYFQHSEKLLNNLFSKSKTNETRKEITSLKIRNEFDVVPDGFLTNDNEEEMPI
jgi:hypothetical protein